MYLCKLTNLSEIFFRTSGNSSKSSEAAQPTIKISEMRKNPNYSKYYIHLCRLIVLGVIPFVLIGYYNLTIYKHICQGPKLFEEDISKRVRQKQENNLSRVLLAIVVLFILCHTLKIFLNFYEMIWIDDVLFCTMNGKDGFPRWSYIVQVFSRFLLVFNSSVNIVIYTCFSGKFRTLPEASSRPLTRQQTKRIAAQMENPMIEGREDRFHEMMPTNLNSQF